MKSLTFGFCIVIIKQVESCHAILSLFSTRSQEASKCGKNISGTFGYVLVCHVFGVSDFYVVCKLLNTRTLTWNLFVECLMMCG